MAGKAPYGEGIVPTLQELLRMEHLVASTGFSLLPKQPVHSVLSGKHASRLRGRGLDFEEVRTYVPGDDIRNIDWRVTARTRQTHTKVFTEEKEKPALVLTDMSPGMFFGSRLLTKSYVAAVLAALAAFKVLKNGDRFGGLVFNEASWQVIAPQRSRKAVLQYLKTLCREAEELARTPRKLGGGGEALEQALERGLSMATHDYLVLVISDFRDLGARGMRHLSQMARHNDVILARISDPLEEELPSSRMVLTDGSMQLLWDAGKKGAGKAYQRVSLEKAQDFKRHMETHGIPVMHLNTAEAVDAQIKALFSSQLKAKKQ